MAGTTCTELGVDTLLQCVCLTQVVSGWYYLYWAESRHSATVCVCDAGCQRLVLLVLG